MNDVSRQRHWENVYATKGESEVSSGNARSLAGVDWTCGGNPKLRRHRYRRRGQWKPVRVKKTRQM